MIISIKLRGDTPLYIALSIFNIESQQLDFQKVVFLLLKLGLPPSNLKERKKPDGT
jgi:hypothetical protein